MKKVIFSLFLLTFLLSSCNKGYTCVCTFYNEQGETFGSESTNSPYYKNKDRDKAELACKGGDMDAVAGGNGKKCKLK